MRLNKGQFLKGSTPWNKGKTGYMGANRTSFKKGDLPVQTKPKGSIRKHNRTHSGKVAEWYINIDWHGNRKTNNNYKWYLWEVEHQQDRPQGHTLWIKNGNPDDIRLENLELITRAELLQRNQGR